MERWWYCSFEHFCLWSLGGIIITKRFGGGRREAEPLKDPMTQETRSLPCSQTSSLVPSLASLEMGGRILSWVVLMPAGRGMMVTEQKSYWWDPIADQREGGVATSMGQLGGGAGVVCSQQDLSAALLPSS